MEKHFIDPALLESLGELWSWFKSMPDLTKHYIETMGVTVTLNDDTIVTFYEDGIEYGMIPVEDRSGNGNV